ncbi:type I restriction endonuclease subunit R, EcoR124 family, partial [Klebsiella pneumoniae]
EKVLKFKVDYNDVRPQFKAIETETDEKKITAAENKHALLHPMRIAEVTNYILQHFRQKTHRAFLGAKGFNAMFAVSSVDAAKAYYESFRHIQKLRAEQDSSYKPLTVATIFSYAANEAQDAIGDINDESIDTSEMNPSSREFLESAIADYNAAFKMNFSTDGNGFQDYYRDLAKRVKSQEVDLLIVVGMFLTGFDAPALNTLFVDKNLRYHGLMQAFSRTNRIYNATKTFGNIVTFRDLEQATIDAITLFGKSNTKSVVMEKSYTEYMEGFTDAVTGETRRGFIDIVRELETRFPDPADITSEKEKKAFIKLFGEYLRAENILQNYDEFTALRAIQTVDINDPVAVDAFKAEHFLDDEKLAALQSIRLPSEREVQDYRSSYNDIRDWQRKERESNVKGNTTVSWDDVVFEVDLLKSQEINLDYILELIFEYNKQHPNKETLKEEVTRLIRASLGNRAKEGLMLEFIGQTDIDNLPNKESVIEQFYTFAQAAQQREAEALIQEENLNHDAARRYISASLKREYATENGTALNEALPKLSPLNPQYKTKKKTVFQKVSAFIDKFKGVGGRI